MNEMIELETIYRQERQRWLREEAPRKSVRTIIAESVPYWIVLVALVLYGLSAPHTAGVFDKLTPGWGFIAPIGVEFGLLYSAFRRRLAKERDQELPWMLWALELLLFITAMLVNGAGSFTSVVAATRLDSLSFAAILGQFEQLPATSQAALIMAGLSAFIIPIGTLVAGEGLAQLVLEPPIGTDYRETSWREVAFTVVYRAVFVRYLQQGIEERDARLRATAEVKGYLGRSSSSPVRLLYAPSGQDEKRTDGQAGRVKTQVQVYLDEHPQVAQLTVRQVLSQLRSDGIQAGRTTVNEVLQERRRVS